MGAIIHEVYDIEDIKRRGHMVVLQNLPDEEKIMEMARWLESPAAEGNVWWVYGNYLGRGKVSLSVNFSDEDTAFAFKMRWA